MKRRGASGWPPYGATGIPSGAASPETILRRLKQFYAARRRLSQEFPDGKVDMKKLSEEYSTLEQTHSETYAQFKTIREDLQRLWSVKSKIDTARSFHERTEEQTLQNQPQTRRKKEDIDR